MKKILWLVVVLAIGTVAWYGIQHMQSNTEENSQYQYVTKTVTQGDIRNTVSATGTLVAVDDVTIGAQLSGQVTEVFVDFNDKVQAGQLLAQIDPRSFQAKVDQAQAQINKTLTELEIQKISIEQAKIAEQQAALEYKRGADLKKNNFISATEYEQLSITAKQAALDYRNQQAQLKSLQASLVANQASLTQAELDLNHSQIRSPIDGYVINRTIEQGQTVASSLNTPELFTVAKDLTQMEIEAYIDESDIGAVTEGQAVDFTVDAFPERQFKGQVKQIRHAPQTNSGVISYVVIISTNNPQGNLLPGMTANLEINIDAVQDVNRIDNAALRVAQKLHPTQNTQKSRSISLLAALNLTSAQKEQLQQLMPKLETNNAKISTKQGNNNEMSQKMKSVFAQVLTPEQLALQQALHQGKIKTGTLMVLENHQPQPISVLLGISDSQYTQIISPDLQGKQIITQVKEIKPE